MSNILPGQLRLSFSIAADIPRIEALFDPAVKSTIDPQGQVAGRDRKLLHAHIAEGRAGILQDDQGHVHTLSMAWYLSAPDDRNFRPRHTEIGSAMTRLPGFHSAAPVIAALALREWWSFTLPRGIMAGEVSNDNIPSQKLFRDTLGWKPMTDKRILKGLNDLSYAGVVNYAHQADQKTWYQIDKPARQKLARILLDFMDRGTLVNKQGTTIKLDLSCLEHCGLTRPRLEALADGITSKKALRAIAPGAAPR